MLQLALPRSWGAACLWGEHGEKGKLTKPFPLDETLSRVGGRRTGPPVEGGKEWVQNRVCSSEPMNVGTG